MNIVVRMLCQKGVKSTRDTEQPEGDGHTPVYSFKVSSHALAEDGPRERGRAGHGEHFPQGMSGGHVRKLMRRVWCGWTVCVEGETSFAQERSELSRLHDGKYVSVCHVRNEDAAG